MRTDTRYRDQGVWGLVDARSARGSTPTGNVDERVVEAARMVIAAQTDTSTGTRSRVIDQIRDCLDEQHGSSTVELPSRATLYRLLDTLSKGRHTFGSATTRRSTALKPAGVYTATTAARPGEQVQMDATVLDVMAVMDDGVIGRPELVLSVDIATRTICSGVLRPVGAKAVDAALLLARSTVPEPMWPGPERSHALRMRVLVNDHPGQLSGDGGVAGAQAAASLACAVATAASHVASNPLVTELSLDRMSHRAKCGRRAPSVQGGHRWVTSESHPPEALGQSAQRGWGDAVDQAGVWARRIKH